MADRATGLDTDTRTMISVGIADDQELLREGLALIVDAQTDMEVVGHADDGVEAVRLARDVRPDVLLMDVRMPRMNGVEATRRILTEGQATKVLVLTMFDLDEYVYDALRAGASGFLLKDGPRASLIAGIRSVVAGDVLLAPTVTRRLLEHYTAPRGPIVPHAAPPGVTHREHEVLAAVAAGLSNPEIAARLHIGEATVKTHVARLLAKLGQRDRVQLVIFAYETGMVTAGATSSTPARGSGPPWPERPELAP